VILLQRIAGAFVGLALFVAAFVFASVILAVAATVALVLWGWLWWRTRDLRRAVAERQASMAGEARDRAAGSVIEGEVIRTETRLERDAGSAADEDGPPPRP